MSILNNTDRKTLLIIFFIIIIVNTLHKYFSIINLYSESWQHQSLDMCAIRNTLTHGCQIFVFVYLAPIYTPFERTLQHEVEPNASTATITFHERMGNVHFHVFVHNLIKGCFGHSFYYLQSIGEVHTISESKTSFGYILSSDLSCKVIQSSKEISRYLLQTF